MLRVRFVVSVATITMGAALAGCSSISMPSWVPFTSPSPPALVTLQFESQPPGAEVRTQQGQTCQTPCSLAVQPQAQAVTFAKNGFLPQTVQVAPAEPAEHSLFESPPPTLTPNPVEAALQPSGPARRMPVKPKPHRAVSSTVPPPPQQ
jgi:hypothetical protein